jgi:Protein of unknown function (DUF3135).
MSMSNSAPNKMTFDEWSTLASSDSDAFEAQRAEVIEDAIRRAPEAKQDRLRRLQWRIDQVRRTSGTPLVACLRISGMMWDSVLGENGLIRALKKLGDSGPSAQNERPTKVAKILPFRLDRAT